MRPGQVRLDQGENRRDHGRWQEIQRIPGRPGHRAQSAGRTGALVCRDERGTHLLFRAASASKIPRRLRTRVRRSKAPTTMESTCRRRAFQNQRAHRLLPGAGSGHRATGRGVGLAEPVQDRGGRSGPCQGGGAAAKFDAAGVYGIRISVQTGDPLKAGLPPYMARLIVSADPTGRADKIPG